MARKEKVTEVIDGDTFRTDKRKNPVRLANVQAPEKGKSGSAKATDNLKRLIQGKEVTIETVARDRFGRSIAKVRVANKSVNRAMRDKLKK